MPRPSRWPAAPSPPRPTSMRWACCSISCWSDVIRRRRTASDARGDPARARRAGARAALSARRSRELIRRRAPDSPGASSTSASGTPRSAASRLSRRPRHHRCQGAQEGSGGALPDRHRARRRHSAASAPRAGRGPARFGVVSRAEVRRAPPARDRRRRGDRGGAARRHRASRCSQARGRRASAIARWSCCAAPKPRTTSAASCSTGDAARQADLATSSCWPEARRSSIGGSRGDPILRVHMLLTLADRYQENQQFDAWRRVLQRAYDESRTARRRRPARLRDLRLGAAVRRAGRCRAKALAVDAGALPAVASARTMPSTSRLPRAREHRGATGR